MGFLPLEGEWKAQLHFFLFSFTETYHSFLNILLLLRKISNKQKMKSFISYSPISVTFRQSQVS